MRALFLEFMDLPGSVCVLCDGNDEKNTTRALLSTGFGGDMIAILIWI
jgi:hypothetical protein